MKWIISFLLLASLGYSQILKPKQEALIRKTIANQFGNEIANNCVLNLGRGSFCEVGGDTLYKLPGYHYVFKLQGDSALRLDKSMYHGIDFRSFLFTWKKKLYCLGGYGMFVSHNTLKCFNSKTKEWDFENMYGDIPIVCNGITLFRDSLIYSFKNFISGNNVKSDVEINYLYALNLNNFKWSKYKLNLDAVEFNNEKYEVYFLKDFCVTKNGNFVLIVNIKTGDVFNVPAQKININSNSIVNKVNNNVLFTETDSIDIDKKFLTQFKICNLIDYGVKQNVKNYYWFFLSPIIITLIFVLFKIKIKKNRNKNKINSYKYFLKEFENKTVDVDDLDKILNISHLEADSKRIRRHRILVEIEKSQSGLIKRIKDPSDKRKFLYQIKNVTEM